MDSVLREISKESLESLHSKWQDVTDMLAELAGVETALIMRFQEPYIEVQVRSAQKGNPYEVGEKETFESSGLYCETVIKSDNKLLVPNALKDENWKDNPDVKLNMISYLGFPIHYPDHSPFGTLCILDNKENSYNHTIEKLMEKLRDMIEYDLQIVILNHLLGHENHLLSDYLTDLQKLKGFVKICSSCKAVKNVQGEWWPIEHYLIRHPKAEFSHGFCPDCFKKLYPELAEKADEEK